MLRASPSLVPCPTYARQAPSPSHPIIGVRTRTRTYVMADAAPKASRLPSPVLPPGFVLPVHTGSEHRHAWSDEWIERVLFRPSHCNGSQRLDSASAYIYTQLSFTEGTPGTRHEQAMLGQGNDTGWPCATYNVVAVALQRRT
jgi:hypothetical protein